MKLFHYVRRDRAENFGDRLNLWLWPRQLPNAFEADEGVTFVGIGTLINHLLPQRLTTPEAIIFSTGVGYERPLKYLPATWRIYCVRGPLSAQALGLSKQQSIADGGLLLSRHWPPTTQRHTPVAFMPHIHHATAADHSWQAICQDAGWGYIDPRWPVERVLTAIGDTELLLAEAMHGAIAADALRVPWIPVHTSAHILPFKWQDWCASVGVPYRPAYLPPLTAYRPVARGVRSGLRATRHWGHCWQQHRFAATRVIAHLQHIAASHPPSLSCPDTLESLVERLEAKLSQLHQDMTLRAYVATRLQGP